MTAFVQPDYTSDSGSQYPTNIDAAIAVLRSDLVVTHVRRWFTGNSADDNSWSGIAWSPELGLFAAVATTGTGNRVMTSL